MFQYPIVQTLTLTLLLGLASAACADSELRAQLLASGCTSCHGPNGHSPDAIPAIAGKKAGYIARHLRQYKNDKREATVMNRLAKGYSDEEIELIADWFAKQ